LQMIVTWDSTWTATSSTGGESEQLLRQTMRFKCLLPETTLHKQEPAVLTLLLQPGPGSQVLTSRVPTCCSWKAYDEIYGPTGWCNADKPVFPSKCALMQGFGFGIWYHLIDAPSVLPTQLCWCLGS
jgi:hypothetical protein